MTNGNAVGYFVDALVTGAGAFIGDGIVSYFNVPFLNEAPSGGLGGGGNMSNYEYITYLISLGLVGAGAMSIITRKKIFGFGADALFKGAGAGIGTHFWNTTGSQWVGR